MKFLLLCLVLSGCAGADQVNCVKLKDSTGATIATYCKPFTLKAGSNVTFTNDDIAKVATISSAISSTTIGGAIRIANTFPGSDLGAQINAADADLGSSAGEIWVTGGGAQTTQVIVSGKHTLRLFEGTYTNAFGEYIPPFLLKDNSALICDSWQTIIQNSSNVANSENNIISVYNATISGSGSAGALIPNNARQTSSNITVKGCQFTDGGTGNGSSLTGQVALVNCTNCKVLDNFFNGAHGTHITLVGKSDTGNFGYEDEIAGNHSTGAKDAAVSIINNSNVNIHDNFFHGHGNGAAAFIDLEGNLSTDYMQYIDVHDNLMDGTDATNTVYGVTLNSAGTNQHNIKIHDNVIYGLSSGSNKLQSCITGGASGTPNSYTDVEISNNHCYWTVSDGISVGGIARALIDGNHIHCAGGSPIHLANNVFDSLVQGNVISAPLSGCSGTGSTYRVLLATTIKEDSGADRNIYKDNIAGRITLSGSNSKVFSNSTIEATGKTERVPVGFTSIGGSLAIGQLSAPTLSVTTGAVGSCVLSSGNYTWRVTAVDAAGGESAGSNQVTQNAGGGFGCAELSWTFVPGAVSFNVYRALSSGPPELFMANVSDFSRAYADLGGQTPGAAYPSTNSTGGVLLNSETAPTCAAAFRGLITYTFGGAGVKDTVQVCAKDGADAYAYRAIY